MLLACTWKRNLSFAVWPSANRYLKCLFKKLKYVVKLINIQCILIEWWRVVSPWSGHRLSYLVPACFDIFRIFTFKGARQFECPHHSILSFLVGMLNFRLWIIYLNWFATVESMQNIRPRSYSNTTLSF